MNDWAGFFLGVIALCAVAQCAAVVFMARSVMQSGERLSEVAKRLDSELRPALDDLRKGAANLSAISDSGREQALRIEALLATTLESVETTVDRARTLVLKPLESLGDLASFWTGLRSGLDAYRSTASRRTAAGRRSEDSDEHMFIG